MYDNRFDNRHAIVTGGASGIGAAVTRRLLAEGATVTVWDIDQAALDAMAGTPGRHMAKVDVTDPEAVTAARDATPEARSRST